MAKVSILEGQLERNFSGVKLLRTDLSGGGSCEWIPEDKIQLTTLNISKNGTYKASDYTDRDGNKYYGFSEVTVNVTGRTTIVDPDDGNEYSVETDTETGELKKTVLPSYIDIVGLPTKTTYRDGDPINKSGMVVKAYLADGTLYNYKNYQFGGIPLSELEIEPTIAHGNGGDSKQYTDGDGCTVIKSRCIEILPSGLFRYNYEPVGTDTKIRSTAYWGAMYITQYDGYLYIASETEIGTGGSIGVSNERSSISSYCNLDKKLAAKWSIDIFDIFDWRSVVPVSEKDPTNLIAEDFRPVKTADEVTVKWKRPEDHKELTDTFEITVISANISGGETQGSDTGGDGNTTGGGGGSW